MIRILFAMLLITLPLQAQERFDPDDLFNQARELGFSGKHEESRELCNKILDKFPNYNDVRIFLGRLLSWDGKYDDARRNLLEVVSKAPGDTDALGALIDVELWSGNSDRALEDSENGLRSSPNNEMLLYKKAQALYKLNRPSDAADSLQRILDRNPGNQDARSMIESLPTERSRYKVNFDYGYDRISLLSPWHENSVSLSRETSIGSVVGRFNDANRFSTRAHQYEIEAYPGLRQGSYAYLNYGYSAGSIFPKHKAAFEIFLTPSKGLELSAGIRYLHFSNDVWIYTGAAGKYLGKYFVSFRPFITAGTVGKSLSGTLLGRRYFGDSDSYLEWNIGAGSAPDDTLRNSDLERVNSFKIGGSGSLPVHKGVYLKFGAGWDSEQLTSGGQRNLFHLSTGVMTRF